jgi:hypothetical protein
MSGDENGNSVTRVTMRTLNDKLAIIRAEQRTEHIKTRALVVILAVPSVAKALPYVLGYLGWH